MTLPLGQLPPGATANSTVTTTTRPGDAQSVLRILGEFMGHAAIGVTMFLLIAGAAVLISSVVHVLEERRSDQYLILGLKTAEYGLLAIDVLLFLIFMLRAAFRTLRRS